MDKRNLNSNAEFRIIQSLLNKELSILELSREIKIAHNNLTPHLNRLISDKLPMLSEK